MALFKKTVKNQNLDQVQIYIEDSDNKYFRILDSPGIIPTGRSTILIDGSTALKRETDIFVNTEAQVKGQVYCQGYLELQGTIEGTVYTNYFLTKASGSRYINHIYDGRIIANSESIQYAGLPIVNSQKTILQWLY